MLRCGRSVALEADERRLQAVEAYVKSQRAMEVRNAWMAAAPMRRDEDCSVAKRVNKSRQIDTRREELCRLFEGEQRSWRAALDARSMSVEERLDALRLKIEQARTEREEAEVSREELRSHKIQEAHTVTLEDAPATSLDNAPSVAREVASSGAPHRRVVLAIRSESSPAAASLSTARHRRRLLAGLSAGVRATWPDAIVDILDVRVVRASPFALEVTIQCRTDCRKDGAVDAAQLSICDLPVKSISIVKDEAPKLKEDEAREYRNALSAQIADREKPDSENDSTPDEPIMAWTTDRESQRRRAEDYGRELLEQAGARRDAAAAAAAADRAQDLLLQSDVLWSRKKQKEDTRAQLYAMRLQDIQEARQRAKDREQPERSGPVETLRFWQDHDIQERQRLEQAERLRQATVDSWATYNQYRQRPHSNHDQEYLNRLAENEEAALRAELWARHLRTKVERLIAKEHVHG